MSRHEQKWAKEGIAGGLPTREPATWPGGQYSKGECGEQGDGTEKVMITWKKRRKRIGMRRKGEGLN